MSFIWLSAVVVGSGRLVVPVLLPVGVVNVANVAVVLVVLHVELHLVDECLGGELLRLVFVPLVCL